MSDRLEKLRAAVLLAGEAALRQRLVELGLGPKIWQHKVIRADLHQRHTRSEISRTEWHEQNAQLDILLRKNPFQDGKGYADILLRECCTDKLWASLEEQI